MRAVLIVLDGVGTGPLPDVGEYNKTDKDPNTLLHVINDRLAFLPLLSRLGFSYLIGKKQEQTASVAVGRISPITKDNDSAPIHWEMMGMVRHKRLPVYPKGLPADILNKIEALSGYRLIGNVMIERGDTLLRLRDEHIRTKDPIIYTTTDSVIQIAAMEKYVSLKDIYNICRIARDLIPDAGRIVAKPFFIDDSGQYQRDNKNRRDYTLELPKNKFLLPLLIEKGIPVIAIGKIADFFQNQGISQSIKTSSNTEGTKKIIQTLRRIKTGLIFANLVDFDIMGHSNNTEGMFSLLQEFDGQLKFILDQLLDDDILIITSDHGCDPTLETKTHTREYGLLIFYKHRINKFVALGSNWHFNDIASTISHYFKLDFKPGKIIY